MFLLKKLQLALKIWDFREHNRLAVINDFFIYAFLWQSGSQILCRNYDIFWSCKIAACQSPRKKIFHTLQGFNPHGSVFSRYTPQVKSFFPSKYGKPLVIKLAEANWRNLQTNIIKFGTHGNWQARKVYI